MTYEVIMGLSASYAIVFVETFTECPLLCADVAHLPILYYFIYSKSCQIRLFSITYITVKNF